MCFIVTMGRQIAKMFSTFSLWGCLFIMTLIPRVMECRIWLDQYNKFQLNDLLARVLCHLASNIDSATCQNWESERVILVRFYMGNLQWSWSQIMNIKLNTITTLSFHQSFTYLKHGGSCSCPLLLIVRIIFILDVRNIILCFESLWIL